MTDRWRLDWKVEWKVLALVAALVLGGRTVTAASVTYSAASDDRRASVTFSLTSNSALLITLSNTSLFGASSSQDVLTGFFYSSLAAPLTPQSILAGQGSAIHGCPGCQGSDLTSEWLWTDGAAGLTGALPATLFAISGMHGVDFGLVSNSTSFGQSAVTGSPLVSQTMVIAMNGGMPLDAIRQVGFLWGGRFDLMLVGNPDTSNPEPAAAALTGVGLFAMTWVRRRRMTQWVRT